MAAHVQTLEDLAAGATRVVDKWQGAVASASTWQVRQPIYRSSVGRWRRYEDELAPLIAALGDVADV